MRHFKKIASSVAIKALAYNSYSLPSTVKFSTTSIDYQILGVTGGVKPYTVSFAINGSVVESAQFNSTSDPLDISATTGVHSLGGNYISLILMSADGQTLTTPSVRVST
jgi:hypothetical protein